MHGAYCLASHCTRFIVRQACNAEIRHFYGAVLQQHDILRLDVAVYYPFAMRVLKCTEYLHYKMYCFFPLYLLLLVEVFLKRNAIYIFFDYILYLVTDADIINFHYIRM